jgi:hypothetical protein
MIPLIIAADFMNFTYLHNPCAGNVTVPIVMRAGTFTWASPKDLSWAFTFHVERVIEGSLAPGTRQAVVVIACDAPVDGGAAEAYLFKESQDSATYLKKVGEAEWGTDWGVPPSSIHIRFAKNFLYVDQCEDATSCDHYIVTTYALRDGTIVKVNELEHERKSP